MRVAWLALLVPFAAGGVPSGAAQDSNRSRPTQESATVRYKEVPEIVEEIAQEVRKHDKALVVWLLDNTVQFKTSKHADLLARHLVESFRGSAARHSVFVFGEKPARMLEATPNVDLAAASIRGVAEFMPPEETIKNCLLNIREAAVYAAGASGAKKFLVAFTQANGDNEDDVEGTLGLLKKIGVSLYSIAPEAMYSDPLWDSFLTKASRFGPDLDPAAFKKLPFQLKGPESAYLEFPYGWPYVWFDPTYTVPSGFGYYALDRLSSHTGGKYFMYSVDRPTRTFCQFQPDQRACPVCVGRHKACGAVFDPTKLLLTAPEIGSRAEVLARYAAEPLFLANLSSWARLHHEGILRGEPQLEAGGGLGENRGHRGSRQGNLRRGNLATIRRGALRDAEVAARTAQELHEAEKQLGAQADRRVLATNDALIVHYKLLAETLKQAAAFCEELDRATRGGVPASPRDAFARSEFEDYAGKTVDGFHFVNVFLCHGGQPLKSIKFLGDLKELHATLDLADRMIEKHRGTPWEILIRRACLPVFTPTFAPGPGKVEKPKAQSSGQNAATTPAQNRPQRPARGAADNGAAAGTRTGP
jgi:hypothetical protein